MFCSHWLHSFFLFKKVLNINIQEDEGQKQNHEEISWKKREKITKKKEVKTKDIRQFFAPVVSPRNEDETRRTEEEQVLEIVEID